ncbi:hypothetical protein HF086_005879 [Spodoptera exigua]|uniref:Uncharacterized protein n=1 Tax=Spodoptera exigua TaxID=7107 RepID=A0A922SCZ9_SPOEX|nr:hypothetical protein HF086_005879 [Spodoptera exigua]
MYSGQIYKEAALGGSEIYGQSAGARQGRSGVHLPAPWGECDGLEGHPRRHHAGEFHQQHRLQFLHRGHNVSTAACFPPLPLVPLFCFGGGIRNLDLRITEYSNASSTRFL